MIEIKDISGKTRFSTPINKGAKGKFTLMKEDYIVLPFSVPEPIYFKLGDYVDLSGVLDDSLGGLLSKVYEVTDLQKPSFNASTAGYDYELKLDAYYWKWKNKIFKYTPEHAGYEASWSLTAALDVQLGVFLRNLKALGYTYKGKEFVFEIDSTVENKAVAMTYDNMNLLDALFSMAGEDKWNCDCWITDNVIHFGRNEFGDAVKIELGVEASAMTRSESKGTYATRIYAFGSTRNIPENYRPIEEQTVVNGVVQRRLMLPAGTPYIDVYPDMSQEEAIEDIVVFDEVYPRLENTMSSVSTRTETVTNEDGGQETVTYYRYRDTGLNFSKDYRLPGQELTIIFQSGKMNGLEFGVIFDPDNNGSQLWEIVRSEDYGRPLPDDTIYPENDDKYILSGFDPKFVSVQMIPDAEQELKEKAQKIADQRKKDDGTYYTTLRSEWVNEDKLKRFFEFGQKINLVNKAFFENGRESRVLGWEFNLDIPWDSPVYTIGESMPYSRLNDVEEKLESITYKGHTYVGGGGSSIYVIKTNDSTAPSDSNVFSAKRSLATLLRKDKEDQTNYLIKLLGGIISPFLESIDFVTGMMGAGMSFSSEKGGESVGWIDKLYVRKKAIFQLLSIMETELAGASFMFNASGARATITKVEFIEKKGIRFRDGKEVKFSDGKRGYSSPGTYGSVYRCYFLADDGEKAIENRFKPGNLVRSQSFNIKEGAYDGVSNHYWWRLVENVGDNWIEVSVNHCDEGSDIPKVGDVMVQLGDIADPDYQAAIVLSAYGDGAPSLTFYQGISSYSLSGKDIVTIGYDRVKKEGYFNVYGRAYIGNREQTNYLSLSDGKLVGRFSELMLSSGKSVVEVAKDEISLELEDTGINVKDRTVTVHADNFFVTNTSGEPIAVFTTDKNGRPIVKAEYIDVDNLKVKHLDGAEGSLERGSIGGFELANGRIGSEATASGGGGSLSIYSDMIRVGGTSSYVLIGKNVVPATASGFTAAGRIINNQTNTYGGYGFDVSNYGLFIEVSGGTKNYGLKSNAPLMATAFIGTKIGRLNITGSTYKIDFSQNNIFFIYASSAYNVTLPDESQVASMYGMSSLPSDFGLMLVFRCLAGSKNVTLAGIYDQNGSVQSYTLAVGDSIILLVAKVPYFGYFLINYTS
ncbi:hypothetical protein [Phocaeicola plebeius]|uniref:hypothetical protein n=1 Tax=Phocaeicola plebeius TaxID=310297 RepID=UPI0026F2EE9D|nr:hypothetical protein [Phocaeicola plebeius]